MPYSPPVQSRARTTERKLLAALDELLRVNGYINTTIDEVAERAGLAKPASYPHPITDHSAPSRS